MYSQTGPEPELSCASIPKYICCYHLAHPHTLTSPNRPSSSVAPTFSPTIIKAPTHSPTPAPTTLAPTAAPTTAVPTAAPTRACESGTFIDTSHPDRCQPCRAGRFSDAPNSLTCTTCSAGRVAALDRSTYCALCPGYVPTTPHNTCAQYTHTPLHLTNYCKISGAHILRMAWIRSRLLLSTTPLATAWIVSRAWYPQTTARHAMRVHQGQGLCPTAPGTQPRPPAINKK